MAENDITPEAILKNLKTSFVGQTILYYPVLPSTMDAAKSLAQAGAAEGTVVVAGEQTAGRGRLGREWLSPQGSLAFSVILYPTLAQLPRLIMIASLAVVHSIEAVANLKPQIKWPNDVLIQGRKVCGILIENVLEGNQVKYAIIGIGLNISLDPKLFPQLSDIAISLSAVTGKEISPRTVIRHLLRAIERYYLEVKAGEPIHLEWQSHLETLGKQVQVRWGEQIEEGYAEAVDSEGSLWLRRSDGSLTRIIAGEVTLSHHSPRS